MALARQAQGVQSAFRKFSIPVRVYYEDTDAGGIVYHATYLRFMERARTDFLRHLGFEHQRLATEFGVQFVVTAMTVKFLRPALLDELVEATAAVESLGRARVVFVQTVERRGVALVRASVTAACLELGSMKPVPIPQPLREKM
jgi:acyl-CoA thioester hydrolase